MNINKIAEKVHKIAPTVKVEEYRGCVKLTGELDDWDLIYKAGNAAVDNKHSLGVINDIRLKGFVEKVKTPTTKDNAIDGLKPDVLVIGGGIVGCAILRELSRLDISALLVEKCNDVGVQASSRNDGCIHPGIDLHLGQQKLKYVKIGNEMYTQIAEDFGLDLKRWAQMFMFSTWWERLIIPPLYKIKAKIIGVKGISFVSKKKIGQYEQMPPKWYKGGMYMATGGVISPYKATIAFADNAIENGAQVSLDTIVEEIKTENEKIVAVKTNRGTVYPKIVVNAAGVFSDVIADMAGDRTFTIHPRKGTDLILDKKKAAYALSSYARSFFAPLPPEARPVGATAGHTKGGGIMRTVDGNILVGPDAVEQPYREDFTTDMVHIDNILRKQKLCIPEMSRADVITYFSGVRAATYEEDFVVRKGIFTKNIIEAAGIQSPGITAAPAIAVDVREWAKEMLGAKEKANFNPKRAHTPCLAKLPPEEREEYIKKKAAYGERVCRWEEVSKGESRDAHNSSL
ncbi:MAG: FAD-dependent oxidoreductase, partial [Clostridia bacterium]|nr:FAD-dependent oxidoreductase [Clostridia bacterium]